MSSGWESTLTPAAMGLRRGRSTGRYGRLQGSSLARSHEVGLTMMLTLLLREAAVRRLVEVGVRAEQAKDLVSLEPRLGDAWLAYLALAPISVIDDLTG